MCRKCMRELAPSMGTVCREEGFDLTNLAGCHGDACGGAMRMLKNVDLKRAVDEDGMETVTFKHACRECGHIVSSHHYTFVFDGRHQWYTMDCLLCGRGRDKVAMPYSDSDSDGSDSGDGEVAVPTFQAAAAAAAAESKVEAHGTGAASDVVSTDELAAAAIKAGNDVMAEVYAQVCADIGARVLAADEPPTDSDESDDDGRPQLGGPLDSRGRSSATPRGGTGGAASGGTGLHITWVCGACTYDNETGGATCSMCGGAKPSPGVRAAVSAAPLATHAVASAATRGGAGGAGGAGAGAGAGAGGRSLGPSARSPAPAAASLTGANEAATDATGFVADVTAAAMAAGNDAMATAMAAAMAGFAAGVMDDGEDFGSDSDSDDERRPQLGGPPLPSRHGERGSGGGSAPWVCGACTFENTGTSVCDMCGSARTRAPAIAGGAGVGVGVGVGASAPDLGVGAGAGAGVGVGAGGAGAGMPRPRGGSATQRAMINELQRRRRNSQVGDADSASDGDDM